MIPKMETICQKCKMQSSIHHLDYPLCNQPVYPMTREEYDAIGANPNDIPTVETVMKLMEISIKPYCRRKMLNAHPIEWWTYYVSNGVNGHL